MPLKEAIFKQTQEGIDKGIKIRTKRGNMGYKEYMEMAVRTTIQNEIGEQQLKFNVDAKVVFYISNVFQDSADDHADYQGKYYYDEEASETPKEPFIQKARVVSTIVFFLE